MSTFALLKVFPMIDTQSLCHDVDTCSMFSKCANDLLCYVNIDLTLVVLNVNNFFVCTMANM